MCLRYIAYWGGKNHIAFIGDARIRQLYLAFVELIQSSQSEPVRASEYHDMSFEESELHLKVDFYWRPYIGESMFKVYKDWLDYDVKSHPVVVVTGSGLWAIKSSNGSLDTLDSYRKNLTRLSPLMDKLNVNILWVLQDPVEQEKLDPSSKMITNELIDDYNKAAIGVLKYASSPKVHVWSSARLVSQGYNDEPTDGLYMKNLALKYALQILMNMYCNDQMNHNDGTCCSDPEPVTTIQILTFVFFGACGSAIAIIYLHRHFTSSRVRWHTLVNEYDDVHIRMQREEDKKSIRELLISLAKFSLLMGYFFLCDRTNFFMKENKYYTSTSFFLPLAYVFSLGLFFTEESRHTCVLHYDQTYGIYHF